MRDTNKSLMTRQWQFDGWEGENGQIQCVGFFIYKNKTKQQHS